MHPIFDADSGERINPPLPINIGNNVRLEQIVRILKGTNLGNGSVVEMSVIVTRSHYPEAAVMAGKPANVVQTNIAWDRDF